MMYVVFSAVVLGLIFLGRFFGQIDQVYGLSLYVTSLFVSLWGFTSAPIQAQISLEILMLGWVQFRILPS